MTHTLIAQLSRMVMLLEQPTVAYKARTLVGSNGKNWLPLLREAVRLGLVSVATDANGRTEVQATPDAPKVLAMLHPITPIAAEADASLDVDTQARVDALEALGWKCFPPT